MTNEEIRSFKQAAEKELAEREEARKKEVLKVEEAEAELNLKNIDSFLSICQHTKNNKCSDDDLKEDAYSSYDYADDVKCVRCYLLSCKKYDKEPMFRLSVGLERYEVLGR
jgi:hypothetical protein